MHRHVSRLLECCMMDHDKVLVQKLLLTQYLTVFSCVLLPYLHLRRAKTFIQHDAADSCCWDCPDGDVLTVTLKDLGKSGNKHAHAEEKTPTCPPHSCIFLTFASRPIPAKRSATADSLCCATSSPLSYLQISELTSKTRL